MNVENFSLELAATFTQFMETLTTAQFPAEFDHKGLKTNKQ
jgi:hypothetical protein